MAKKTKKRTIVGSPLTPELLCELDAVRKFPRPSEDFDPNGRWANTYRIWTCHGYRQSGNQDVGFLRITRSADGSNETFTLKAYQEVVETDGMQNVIEATIECMNNQLASPTQWHLSSRFFDAGGKIINDLATDEKGLIDANVMSIKSSHHTLKREVARQLTCDWCLFEAVQRLSFDRESSLAFDLLEGLSLPKEDQHLSHRGVKRIRISDEEVSLHQFCQLGRGVLPYEYWLDDSHRLLAVITMNKAYILDEQAESIIKQTTEQLRKSYRRSKNLQRK